MTSTTVSLVPIDRNGRPRGYGGALPEITTELFRATVELYDTAGFEEPWVGYLALSGSTPIGTCGFKSPPRDGRVEIAYFTFPDHEGRGFATAMASGLHALALRHEPTITVAAQTLPARNASHRVLEKSGFRHVATIDHPEDGTVWEWTYAGDPDGGPVGRATR
jgi:ribosomal-protein-alanine N-acetyltransferase